MNESSLADCEQFGQIKGWSEVRFSTLGLSSQRRWQRRGLDQDSGSIHGRQRFGSFESSLGLCRSTRRPVEDGDDGSDKKTIESKATLSRMALFTGRPVLNSLPRSPRARKPTFPRANPRVVPEAWVIEHSPFAEVVKKCHSRPNW